MEDVWVVGGGTVGINGGRGACIWQFQDERRIDLFSHLVEAGLVVLCLGNTAVGLDVRRGTKLWEFGSGDDIPCAPFCTTDDHLIVNNFGGLHCLGLKTGKRFWNFRRPGLEPYAATDGERIFATARALTHTQASLYCISADGGELLWRFVTPRIGLIARASEGRVYIAAGGKTVRTMVHNVANRLGVSHSASRGCTKLACLDAERGTLIWEFRTHRHCLYYPVVTGERVYLTNREGAEEGRLSCLDAATGEVIWVFRTHDEIVYPPSVDGDRVYVASRDGSIFCLPRDPEASRRDGAPPASNQTDRTLERDRGQRF